MNLQDAGATEGGDDIDDESSTSAPPTIAASAPSLTPEEEARLAKAAALKKGFISISLFFLFMSGIYLFVYSFPGKENECAVCSKTVYPTEKVEDR